MGIIRPMTFVGMLWCAFLLGAQADSELNALPTEVLDALQSAAINYGWMANNNILGDHGNEAQDRVRGDHDIENARQYASTLLSNDVVGLLQLLAQLQGWYAAQGWHGQTSNQKATGDKCNQCKAWLRAKGQLTDRVFDNVAQMFDSAGWYTAICRTEGWSQQAKSNRAWSDAAKDSIKGDVVLQDIQIHVNTAKVAASTPLVIGENININKGSVSQSTTYTYSHSQGKTSSWSNSFGVTVGISEEITVKAEFLGTGVDSATTFSVESSFSHSWGGGSSEGTTQSYQFTLVTPPHSTYKQTAMVHEANVNADYTMTLSLGERQFTRNGRWYGVASCIMTATEEPVFDSLVVV